ncbi:MAG: T9SS type A sorting domain-containing protein [Bacteroidota bacterium]
MDKQLFLLLAISLFISQGTAQTLTDIFSNVDTLFMPGAGIGNLSPNDASVSPIVSSSPCESPQLQFSLARQYQNGRVIAVGHEAILSNNNIVENDNFAFVSNAITWLNPGNKRVAIKEGWINMGNTSILRNTLSNDNYSFNSLSGNITSSSLSNVDILILGNDWNGSQAYLASELSAIDAFVAAGGGVFIAGLGWSWPQALNQYPMNQVAMLFGFEYQTSIIRDPSFNVNGSPKLYHFYPENLNSSQTPYCPSPFVGINIPRGDSMRILRMAVSTMGEFTQQSGGLNATSLLIEPWLAQINEIYGREYCVRFEIIPNNDLLIFPDLNTDPWGTLPAGSGGCTNAGIILSEQANVIDSIIGAPNYDISHVIAASPFGGGCAGGLKSGLSGGFDIPVTRHEIGHQFSQSHTINHSSNRNYEPESGGWTIQGGNAQGYAHAVSYHQLADFLLNNAALVGTKLPTNNHIPSVDAGPDVVIPISTPFTLTGWASDPDPEDSLTYVWDNMNRGLPQTIPVGDDTQGAIFMRLKPDTNASRTFPQMSDVVANNNVNSQEQLPSQSRIMDIRLTVNDNHQILYNGEMINASGINSDDIQITVADAGPFEVTSQASAGIIYTGGSDQMLSWAVNGTDAPPINTQFVSISLSLDGGYTYPISLLDSTANDGSESISLPNISTTQARLKVAAKGNIYFDINTHDFEIQFDPSNSLEEQNDFVIELYPNPVKHQFQIAVPAQMRYQVQLYDAKGKLLLKQNQQNRFNVADFTEGIYFVVVTNLDSYEKAIKRLVVVK